MYAGFPIALIPSLRCPKDSGALSFETAGKLHMYSGPLVCKSCASVYEIREGIVCMLDDAHLEPEMALEVKERDKNAEDYDRHFSERYEREVVPTVRLVGALSAKTVIEYGAGTGRLTEILSRQSAFYLATDMSFRSLQALARKNLPETIGLVWTEAAGLKTTAKYFDVALTFQMIEHMPRSIRDKFYASVAQSLKPDGYFVASVYHQDMRRRLKGMPQEGKHPNGIFYHCFEKTEFSRELSQKFLVKTIRTTDVVVPLQSRVKLPLKIDGWFSRLFAHVPFLREYGHILMARAIVRK